MPPRVLTWHPGACIKFQLSRRRLARVRAKKPDPYIAFGNDMNDAGLLEGAQYAVAVGSHEALLPLADLTVDPHPDAVAAAIRALAEDF